MQAAELVWSPTRQWNLGAGYGYERYNWTRADADVTHENAGKVFADYKPWSWLLARASYGISDRHYDTYDYRGFVGNFQWANPAAARPPLAAVHNTTSPCDSSISTIASGRSASSRLRSTCCAA